MKRNLLVLACCVWLGSTVQATDNPYISDKNPKLNKPQWQAIKLANDWIKSDIMPGVGENGKIIFPYGASMPFVVTMPLFPSEIEFEPGEVIKDFHLGDTARWKATPAVSGSDQEPVHRLIIKPVDAGLKTGLIINTNRRSYYIHLISRKSNLMPRVGFSFPEDEQKKWQHYLANQQKEKAKLVIADTQESLETLFFDYKIKGHAPFKPLRVYHNGVKTIIQLPKDIIRKEAPSLLVISTGNKERLVNYRVKGDRYIVDEIFDKAILVTGVGGQQKKITIERKGV